jgi:DNA repair protein SbcC/Rad50
MKLLLIEVTNLNSLYGTHTIDLEKALAGASLFLIHGPMGTGKSTLMDAVSLALFGQTPRLDNKRARADRGPERIMSRGTGTCRAEIEFSKLEAGGRARYRAVWMCRRARNKPDGNFQTPERSLEKLGDDGQWATLVSDDRHKFVAPVFKAVLEGFTVEDFNRSMLLAQGRFDAFLEAQPGERAQILERLTQTGIYQQIGNHAAMIAGRHNTRLKRLRTLAAAPGGLQADELTTVKAEHGLRTAALTKAQTAAAQATAHLTWFDEATSLGQRLQQARTEGAAVTSATKAAGPLLTRLDAHERCEALQAFKALDTLHQLTTELNSLAGTLETLATAAPGLKEAEASASKDAQQATRNAETASDDLERLRPQVDRMTQADAEVKTATLSLEETQKARTAAVKKRTEGTQQLEGSREEVAQGTATLAAAQKALVDLVPDATAQGYEAAREVMQSEVQGARVRLRRVETALAPTLQAEEAAKGLTGLRARQREAEGSTTALDERITAATGHVTACTEALAVTQASVARVEQIAKLVTHREELVDGEACPLCGSESHPWVDDPERARKDATIAETVAAAHADRDALAAKAEAAQKSLSDVQGERQRLTGRLEQLAGQVKQAAERQQGLDAAAQQARSEAGLDAEVALDQAVASAKTEVEALAKRLETLEGTHSGVRTAEATLREAEAKAKGKEALLGEYREQEEALAETLARHEGALKSKQVQAEAIRSEFKLLWRSIVAAEDGRPEGSVPPDTATPTARLEAQQGWLERTRGAEKRATSAHRAARDAVKENATRHATMTEQRARKSTARATAKEALAALLVTLELEGVETLTAQRLDPPTLQSARGTRKGLEERRIRNETMVKERHEALTAHDNARPEHMAVATEREVLHAAVAATDTLRQAAVTRHEETAGQLRAHEIQVERHKEARRELAEAEKAARVWRTLHDIIGQNEGGRFQQFAQALNLGQLLEKANVHLQRLNDRYRLVPRIEDGLPTLEFDLEDLWQVGETVSPQSLSGGERFLVSLALALGLSDFRGSSVTMPVETLLLDEGFGTLDPATLSVAMAALSQLQADGRQVGIISHVVGLTERIDARVEVRPLGGGRSEVVVTG